MSQEPTGHPSRIAPAPARESESSTSRESGSNEPDHVVAYLRAVLKENAAAEKQRGSRRLGFMQRKRRADSTDESAAAPATAEPPMAATSPVLEIGKAQAERTGERMAERIAEPVQARPEEPAVDAAPRVAALRGEVLPPQRTEAGERPRGAEPARVITMEPGMNRRAPQSGQS